jgi:phage terminase large subunit-like protein
MMGGDETNALLFGGSRSGKTFLILRSIAIRALASPGSRHAILRFRFNAVKVSVIHDTFPKMMSLCYPGVKYELNKSDWFVTLPNGSEIWFGGLDDKERTEKILGQEYATIFLNECSQISYAARNIALTRLAQVCTYKIGKTEKMLRLKMFYDCNPPSQAHWTYQLFKKGVDPDTKEKIDTEDYASINVNPLHNQANLPEKYIKTLESLPARLKLRFLDGIFGDITEGALWTLEGIESYRKINDIPDMQRIVIAVDPSGSGDTDNAQNDAIGINVCGLGVDGIGYLLEDLTVKAGPATWGNVATTAYDRWNADAVVAEKNFGGAMVEHVIQTSRRNTPYKAVTASRGKVVRAEPVAALAEDGRIRHAGKFPELEDELISFTTTGYMGDRSPNRADAYVWGFTELFGGIIQGKQEELEPIGSTSLW